MVDPSILLELERMGMADILLWVLSFAIVFGILHQVNIPKSKPARAIISIVVSFFVLMAVPSSMVAALSSMSTGLLLIIVGFIVLLAFAEMGGIRHKERGAYDTGKKNAKGEPIIEEKWFTVDLFSKHPYVLGIAFILIAFLIFIAAGGLEILGISIPGGISSTGAIFIIAIIIAILWLIKGEKA
jgi:hypothetical protein